MMEFQGHQAPLPAVPVGNTSKMSKLFNIDYRYEPVATVEEKLERCHNSLNSRLEGLSEIEMKDTLFSMNNCEQDFDDLISCGFLYGILTDPPSALQHFSLLRTFARNDCNKCLYNLNIIIIDYSHRLKSSVRKQLHLFFREAVRNNVTMIDSSISNYLRSINDGSNYSDYCMSIQDLSEILYENRIWLQSLKITNSIPSQAMLILSRFISDSYNQQQNINGNAVGPSERTKNVIILLCEFFLKERFADMINCLGKDLILVLMRLSKLGQFIPYWKKLLYEPELLMPNFGGLKQLMTMPCTKQVLLHRVSHQVWREIDYILKRPTLVEQSKHLEWFAKSHLSSPESSSLRTEFIRVISSIGVIPQEQMPIPLEFRDGRINFLAWLIRNSKGGSEMQMCKMMLFWEWIFFDQNVQNSFFVVGLEPAFNVIRLLLSQQVNLANSLLDFIVRVPQTFYLPQASLITNSITTALKLLEANGQQIMTVLNHSKVDSSIKEALRTTFPELYHKKTSIANSLAEPSEIIDFDAIRGSSNSSTPGLSDATKHAPISVPPSDNGKKESNHSKTKVVKEKIPKKETFEELFAENDLKTSAECEPSTSVSSDQGIVPSTSVSSGSDQGKVSKKRKRKSREKELHVQQLTNGLSTKERDEVVCNHDNHSLEVLLNMIREEFRDPIERLANSLNQNNSESVEVIQSLLNAIIEYADTDKEQCEFIAECLLELFSVTVRRTNLLMAHAKNPKDIFDSSFYQIFRTVLDCNKSENENALQSLCLILSGLRKKSLSLGYSFLLYIKVYESANEDSLHDAIGAYAHYCLEFNDDPEVQLQDDLEQCSFFDQELFVYLFPFVFSEVLPKNNESISAIPLVHLLCRSIDTKQLCTLVGEIIRENFTLLDGPKFFTQLVNQSLKWDSFSQIIIWNLFQAEGLTMDWVIASGIIPKISYEKYPEAANGILLLIKNLEMEPTSIFKGLIRDLMLRPPNVDLFSVDAMKVLLQFDENVPYLADWIGRHLTTAISNGDYTSGTSAQQSIRKTNKTLTVENILSHIDKFRIECNSEKEKNVKAFLSHSILLEKLGYARRNSKMIELSQEKFSEFFAVMEILGQESSSGDRHHRKAKAKTRGDRECTPPKKRKKKEKGSDSDED